MEESKTVAVVCTANICRSPMAAALLRHALAAEPEPLRSVKVVSAGVNAIEGEPASANALRAMRNVGLDISDHRSQSLSASLAKNALALLVMTQNHRDLIEASLDLPENQLFRFRDFVKSGDFGDIPDPYGQPILAYEASRDSMVEAIPGILEFLRKRLAQA